MIRIKEGDKKPKEISTVNAPLQRKAAALAKASEQLLSAEISAMLGDADILPASLLAPAGGVHPPPVIGGGGAAAAAPPAVVPDPRAIEPCVLAQAKVDFGNRYQMYWSDDPAAIGDPMPVSDRIEVLFDKIQEKIDVFIAHEGVAEDIIAVRFIHCLNELANKWFLVMEFCTMAWDAGRSVYVLTEHPGWRYDIDGHNVINGSGLAGDHDPAYFKYIGYYNSLNNVFEQIDPATHIKSVVFPWVQELKELRIQNGLGADHDAVLVFCSCSFEVKPADIGVIAMVQWPHGIVMHMKKDTFDYLGVNNTVLGAFHNRGADIGGLCPPNCPFFIPPGGVPY